MRVRTSEAVELANLEWLDWFTYRRLPEPVGNTSSAKAEARDHAQIEDVAVAM